MDRNSTGSQIFKNQPSYKYFNKSYEDKRDVLFLNLNEIDPKYLETSANKNIISNKINVDPRLKIAVDTHIYNHTIPYKLNFFATNKVSLLSKEQHEVGLRILQTSHGELDEGDYHLWRQCEEKIKIEKETFKKLIQEYEENKRDLLYGRPKAFLKIYRNWYSKQCNKLLKLYPNDIIFTTRLGIPHLRNWNQFETDITKSDQCAITYTEEIERKGYLQLVSNLEDSPNLQIMSTKIEDFFESASYCLQAKEHLLDMELQLHLNKEIPITKLGRFCIPIEILIFLCVAGECVDYPSELLLTIHQRNNLIEMEHLIPTSNVGRYSNSFIINQIYGSYNSLSDPLQWLKLHNNSNHLRKDNKDNPNDVIEYKAIHFDEYLKNMYKYENNLNSQLKINQGLVKWHLQDIEILTLCDLPVASIESPNHYIGYQFIKLEYKAECGCEILTKDELLRAWFQMRLFDVKLIQFVRISTDFHLIARECLSREQIESQLSSLYNIQIQELLQKLYQFLQRFFDLPSGTYMLRSCDKFKDQLLLCAPNTEVTKNIVSLHNLFKKKPSNMVFLMQANHIPIEDNVCGILHTYNRILPGLFSPQNNGKQTYFKSLRKRNINVDDNIYLAKRLKKQEDEKQAKQTSILSKSKSKKRNKRKAIRAKQKQLSANSDRDIEIDKIIFGYS